MELRLARVASPIGVLLVVVDDAGVLRAVEFEGGEARLERLLRLYCGACVLRDGAAPEAARAFDAYFAGAVTALDGLPVATGGTPFQRAVWSALRAIPPGTSLGYGALAARLGRPAAGRAVGAANGANPISIAVPCHRLVGANGALTGYAGGLGRKRWLIEHERRHAPAQ